MSIERVCTEDFFLTILSPSNITKPQFMEYIVRYRYLFIKKNTSGQSDLCFTKIQLLKLKKDTLRHYD